MFSLADVFTTAGLAALGQVIMIDLLLAGDNVMILGVLISALPPKERKQVLALGVGLALVCLITFAWFATQLLHVVGLLFAGGVLLLWVAWKLFREIRTHGGENEAEAGGCPPAQEFRSGRNPGRDCRSLDEP